VTRAVAGRPPATPSLRASPVTRAVRDDQRRHGAGCAHQPDAARWQRGRCLSREVAYPNAHTAQRTVWLATGTQPLPLPPLQRDHRSPAVTKDRVRSPDRSLIYDMSGDADAGARSGQPRNQISGGPRTRVGGYLARGVLSGAALACAGLVVTALSAVAAPLPDRGLAAPTPVAMAAPAALPDVAEPAAAPAVAAPAAQPAGKLSQTVTIPVRIPVSAGHPGGPQLAFAAWATRMSRATGIPQRALEAYANAHAVMAATHPSCHLTWVTLAGIAEVESQHGTIGGRTLLPDGRPSSPIIGPALDGANGNRTIAATDGGLLTGDKVWEHAVGPFQFIASTWALWRADAHGDGMTDPQNIDNAALAAAQYLCADNHNLATGDDWLRAILSYNSSLDYARLVYGFAQSYARSAQGLT
jgi:membrane-bound lytic murein transglycosylase B